MKIYVFMFVVWVLVAHLSDTVPETPTPSASEPTTIASTRPSVTPPPMSSSPPLLATVKGTIYDETGQPLNNVKVLLRATEVSAGY